MLMDGGTGVIYLVDWGSAITRFGTALPSEGTVQSVAARILDQHQLVSSQAVIITVQALNPNVI